MEKRRHETAAMKTRKHGWRRIVALLLTISLVGTSACTSLRAIPLPGSPAQTLAVKVGEHVRVTNRDGQQRDFEVAAIEADALVGPDIRVSYQDIALLEVRRVSKGKTAALVSVVVAVLLIVLAAKVSEGYSDLLSYQD